MWKLSHNWQGGTVLFFILCFFLKVKMSDFWCRHYILYSAILLNTFSMRSNASWLSLEWFHCFLHPQMKPHTCRLTCSPEKEFPMKIRINCHSRVAFIYHFVLSRQCDIKCFPVSQTRKRNKWIWSNLVKIRIKLDR